MLEPLALTCPYCGEGFESLYDESEAAFGAGVFEAIEDCPVCCQPITVRHTLDGSGQRAYSEALRDSDS
ncbi:MAG: CPXCG motif-containing cysteine-rich protein [Pseudomonadota bacterium]|jgi:hypothetical protein|nr:CPXCG motif-containing cysteine-rich protein [Pseudomonadota bacterium]